MVGLTLSLDLKLCCFPLAEDLSRNNLSLPVISSLVLHILSLLKENCKTLTYLLLRSVPCSLFLMRGILEEDYLRHEA